ncbi:unnamed protein product [Heterobilharzia americana]|nr:unnamed protein product [Heterobilharzia americana]
MNTLFPFPLTIPFFSDFYDHIMSQQNINSPSSPCSSSSATTTPTSMLPVNTITTTLPNSYNLAVEILNSLAVHHHHQQQQQRQHIDDKISQKLQFQSPESLQNLSLHLLNMTNSSLNPLNNNNNNNNFMNHIHLSSNNNCHDKFHNSSNSSSCRQFKTSINRIEDVSSMHQDNISNPYERLASWSSALSTASPNAVAAFQHALAQLALLGLSSPSSTNTNGIDSNTMSVDNITNLCESTNPVLNLSQEQTSCKLLNNHFKNYDCDNIPASTVNCSIVNPANMHKKSEEGCKIIIRQTADADEHFFKALRGLKVDVSTDLKSSDFQKTSRTTETCNKISALPSPDKSSIHLLDSSQERIKHLSYVEDKKEEKEKRTRSAAELAVDEHFEKSLAAFRASTSSKKSTDHLLHDDHVKSKSVLSNSKDNNSINNISVSSDSYLQNDIPITFDSKIQHKSLQTVPRGELYDVNSILQYNNDNNIKPTSNPNLTISCENTHFFPLTASVSSRQSTNINEMNAENGMNSLTQVHSPTVSTNRFKMKFASSSTSLPPLLPINSFKPKKNWLAQYDWRYQQSETTNISPTTPNTNQSIFDSSGSSPSSVNITGESMEDVQQISNISMPKLHIISELCNINSLSKNNGKNNDDNNDGLFTEEAPDIKNDQDYIFVHSSSSSCSSSSFSTNNTNEHCEINSNTDQQQHQQRSVNTPPKFGI